MSEPETPANPTATADSATPATSQAASESQEFWDHYARMDPTWGTRPNVVVAQLVEEFATRPGRALDLGCGHGGDALWLAGRGWQVTAADVAQTALDRVQAGAQALGVAERIRPAQHDLSRDLPPGEYDLVSAAYLHTPVDIDRNAVISRAAELVAPGGFLFVIDHASTPPWSWNAGKDVTFPTPHETLTAFGLGSWTVERCAQDERIATGPSGESATVTDNVIVLRRPAS